MVLKCKAIRNFAKKPDSDREATPNFDNHFESDKTVPKLADKVYQYNARKWRTI